MTDLEKLHLIEHAPRGLGDSPANCPVCPHTHPEYETRFATIEGRQGVNHHLISILTGATTIFVAMALVEFFLKRKRG